MHAQAAVRQGDGAAGGSEAAAPPTVVARSSSATNTNNAAAASSATNTNTSMLALMEAWGQLSAHLQQRPQPPSLSSSSLSSDEESSLDSADGGAGGSSSSSSSTSADTSQLILAALKLAVRSLSRTVADTHATQQQQDVSAGGSSSGPALPAVQRSLTLAVALAELYAAGLPLDGASIAAGIVAEAVDESALHINTVQAKLGPEVAALVHDVLAVRHAPDRLHSYDDGSSR